ncbi:MAG: acyl transferase [Saprospiraceae bacterium]|nr:acyl transferase [Saprospiraceae bacterium]
MPSESLRKDLITRIARVDGASFEATALAVFRYQALHNPLYAKFIRLLGIHPEKISRVAQIPFLPIRLFKTYEIQTGTWSPEAIFSSSGTTGQATSRHFVRHLDWYLACTKQGFEHFYGPIENHCILALLPSYLERSGSSLVAMADYFIRLSRYDQSGFFLYDHDALLDRLVWCREHNVPTLLLGVSFALLDLAEAHPAPMGPAIIMETGGMKGRREELTREALHEKLKSAFGVAHIHSEYGMTELLSQAYSKGEGLFQPSPTLRVLIRETSDPFSMERPGRPGAINLIDLANLDTISFIATDDIGRGFADHSFEVLGRLDYSEIRGCNLMVF